MKSIRAKIILTFTCLVLLTLAAGFWSVYNFYGLGTSVSTILKENYESVRAAENMMKSLERGDIALLDASEGEGEPGTVVPGGGVPAYTENRDMFIYWYNEAVRSVSLPNQEPLRDSIRTAYGRYAVKADSMRARLDQGAFKEAKQYYYDAVRPVSDRLRELCLRLFEINQAAMYDAMPRTHAIANQTAYGTMMTSAIALGLSVIAMLWLTRVFITPAEELTDRVKQIGAGKLDLKIDVRSDDEIGQLSREFNKMTERLKRFEQINIEQILSEKRKSEAIVENISDGLIMTDAGMNVLHVNPVIAELYSADPGASAGRPLREVIGDERIVRLVRSCYQENGAAPDAPPAYLEYEKADGHSYFKPRLTRIVDSEGALFGVLLVLQDVTQFRELDRMKSDFIATLSHEFRTPLTSINMTVDILSQGILGPLNDRQKELIDSAKEDCFRLTKLARELLQLSKLESGKLQLKNEELDVAGVIDFSLHPLQLQFAEKGLHLETDIEPDLPRIVADEQQISWVISNLVTNALKHTDKGGRVIVRARHQDRNVQVEVEDTGQGIAPEHLEKIFDKFVQIKQVSSATPGSVGLGLAIAKEIVELYGGRIWVRSTPGKGSTFFFTLPLPVKMDATA
ncbi:MAG TPA: ATP-binding protein [Bacteroidota bacterium]